MNIYHSIVWDVCYFRSVFRLVPCVGVLQGEGLDSATFVESDMKLAALWLECQLWEGNNDLL